MNNEGINYKKNIIQKYGVVLALFLIIIVLSIYKPSFLGIVNLMNILRQVSINGFLAIGVTFVILTGGIDLSVGSIVAFTGVIAALMSKNLHANIFILAIGAMVAGAIIGSINGVIIAKFNVVPFITTLGMMSIARGSTYIVSNGRPITGLDDSYLALSTTNLFGIIPLPVIILLVVFLVTSVILYKTRFGRYVYAIGGNEQSAYISGVKTNNVKILVYTISGLLAGIAGFILTSRVSSGLPQAGQSYELDAIAAVVIGGTSLTGGKGRLFGTLIGILIIGVISNGLDLIGVSSFYQEVVKGSIIILAVMIDANAKAK